MFRSSFCEMRCFGFFCVCVSLRAKKNPGINSGYLARAVDGHFQVGAAVQHGGREHAHGDGLAEPSRRRHQHLLRQMVPPVDLEDLLVVLGEHPVLLSLPEDARARSNEVVVEHALMERALPPTPVQRLQPLPALLHALEPVALYLLAACDHAVLERRPSLPASERLVLALERHAVVVDEVLLEQNSGGPRGFCRGHVACGRRRGCLYSVPPPAPVRALACVCVVTQQQ